MGAGLKALVLAEAKKAGFEVAGVTTPAGLGAARERLAGFLAAGWHGEMGWLARNAERRGDPIALWPGVRSIIMLGLNYGHGENPLELLKQKMRGAIACYAQSEDYHDVVRAGLARIAARLSAASGAEAKIYVDTAPLMEKPLAQAAGLGWQGKHTNLVSRRFGSWLFLGAILTSAEMPPDAPERDHCGSCRRCLEVCPTDAFPHPYQLDARRCIAYLTIEYAGHIPREFRRAVANRVFGCDDCLAVCPWNKFASHARAARLSVRPELAAPALADLLALDRDAFRARFRGTPLQRTGRDRLVRNALIAAGNSGDKGLLPQVARLLADASPLVRAMAVWALAQLADRATFERARESHAVLETDPAVRVEWVGT
jgi:epoxyqueuosine reductase